MKLIAKAIETTGIVDNQRRLLLDESLPVADKSAVRVIVLVTKEVKTDKTTVLPQQTDYVSQLAGLHQEVWQGLDTEAYLKQEREAWESK
jgi:hypothetical protein